MSWIAAGCRIQCCTNLLRSWLKGRVPSHSGDFQIFGFHETVKRLEISSGPLESSYKPAQTLSTDFLEPKTGAVDLTTPSEIGDILDLLNQMWDQQMFVFRFCITEIYIILKQYKCTLSSPSIPVNSSIVATSEMYWDNIRFQQQPTYRIETTSNEFRKPPMYWNTVLREHPPNWEQLITTSHK